MIAGCRSHGQLGHEPRLPDPSLTSDHHERAVAPGRALERRLERAELARATEERGAVDRGCLGRFWAGHLR